MRILLVTYYFPPDLCAGSFRAKALADALVAKGDSIQLDVITTEPNRYESHNPIDVDKPDIANSVIRVPLPEQRYGFKGQVWSFIRFARLARRLIPSDEYDVVVATSSRLMTALLGAYLANKTGAKLYLDIRDIFVETISDVFSGKLWAPARWIFHQLERVPFKRADRINLVSKGFLPYFSRRYERDDYRFFTNGVDEEFIGLIRPNEVSNASSNKPNRLNILYAGNIGEGQGLERVIPELAGRLAAEAKFTVIGDGSTRGKLLAAASLSDGTIEILDAVPRTELIAAYQSADVLFLQLNDLPAFTRVLPSKLFEYAATGKPILAGLGGYSSEFVKAELDGVAIFDPCDVNSAERAFRGLSIRSYDRSEFTRRYLRSHIMEKMADDIISLVDTPHGQ